MPVLKRDILFQIDYQPEDSQASLEALEMILAAAALELSMAVMFEVSPAAWLAGADGRRWRQLVDFDLADLFTTCAGTGGTEDGSVQSISRMEYRQIRSDARTILVL